MVKWGEYSGGGRSKHTERFLPLAFMLAVITGRQVQYMITVEAR